MEEGVLHLAPKTEQPPRLEEGEDVRTVAVVASGRPPAVFSLTYLVCFRTPGLRELAGRRGGAAVGC